MKIYMKIILLIVKIILLVGKIVAWVVVGIFLHNFYIDGTFRTLWLKLILTGLALWLIFQHGTSTMEYSLAYLLAVVVLATIRVKEMIYLFRYGEECSIQIISQCKYFKEMQLVSRLWYKLSVSSRFACIENMRFNSQTDRFYYLTNFREENHVCDPRIAQFLRVPSSGWMPIVLDVVLIVPVIVNLSLSLIVISADLYYIVDYNVEADAKKNCLKDMALETK